MSYTNFFKPAEIAEFKKLFAACDTDSSGDLTLDETAKLMGDAGETISPTALQELYREIDTNGDGLLSFEEFMECMALAKGGGGGVGRRASDVALKFAKTANDQAKIYKVQGAGNSEHSISEDERAGFAEYINCVLASDKFLSSRLPMDTTNEDLFSQCSDGLIFCKLVNIVEPETVDERALNMKQKLSKFQVIENCNLAINAAKSIGCQITNIGASDLMEGRPHLILGIAWQIIRASLLSHISLKDHPELFLLLGEDEALADLMNLPPEKIIIRWVNYHLGRAGSDRKMKNYGSDLVDSEIYSVLLNQIDAAACPLITGSDRNARAEQVIVNARHVSAEIITQAADITKGNTKLNLALLAQVFNSNPGLTIEEEDLSRLSIDMADLNLDDAGDTREERTFRMWINSLDIEDLYVNELFTGLQSGKELLKIMDKIEPGLVQWSKVSNKNTRFATIGNCNLAVEAGRKLGLVLVNIGGTDICDKNKKLILAVTWQLMRRYTCDMLAALSGTGELVDEAQVVAWANSKVAKSGKTGRMRSMKDQGLKSGRFLLELCAAVSPCVDWDLLTPGTTPEEQMNNARYAISVARKIGACVFLTPEDIVEVKSKMLFTFVASLWAADLAGPAVGATSSPAKEIPSRMPQEGAAEEPPKPKPAPQPAASAEQPPKPATKAPPPLPPKRVSIGRAADPGSAARPPPPQPPARPTPPTPPKREPVASVPAPKPAQLPPAPAPKLASGPPPSQKPLPSGAEQVYTSEGVQKPGLTKFTSINGSGEKGGLYGSASNHASDDVDVEEDEWDD